MAEQTGTFTGNKENTSQSHAMQVKINLQQSEHTSQPFYANFASVQAGQGVVIVDFGFLDPQTMNAFNRMIKSSEKIPATINGKMSCRMAISIDAASQLTQQLNQLLRRKVNSQMPVEQENATDQTKEKAPSDNYSNGKNNAPENSQSGFRFPWSRKN
ncbi:hypothetical protein [Nitrosomonas sp. Nm166]|uniref:hypothetical protein n=1 Tax=Nitrosomonas sp. Nm166 TaxID=1881054 RepID=UPI0008E8D26E|nr:hypothetical protein [Nitrosomonas sp. Nm166]SFE95344.1 hypothetical protein SAMN05428977_10389 [Nitrosomonas sp. Nm166]